MVGLSSSPNSARSALPVTLAEWTPSNPSLLRDTVVLATARQPARSTSKEEFRARLGKLATLAASQEVSLGSSTHTPSTQDRPARHEWSASQSKSSGSGIWTEQASADAASPSARFRAEIPGWRG